MMSNDPHLIVRSASLYVVVLLTLVGWMVRRPSRLEMNGALLGFFWNVPAVLLLHVAATSLGWWRFDADGGMFLGLPVNGRRVSFFENVFYGFRDGRIEDVRSIIDKVAIETWLEGFGR